MKTAQLLGDMLAENADRELNGKLIAMFKPIEDLAKSLAMDHVEKSKIDGGGYFETKQDVWPYHMVQQAKVAMFEGMKRANKEKYIANFIAKVDSLQSQIESIQQEIQQ